MFKLVLIVGLLLSSLTWAQENTAKAFVVLNPAGDFAATLKVISGYATLSSDGKYRAKNIVIDLNTLATGLDLRDDHAKNKYLEVKKYPQAIMLEAIGANGNGRGKLRLHGKESIVGGTYKVINGGKSLTADFKIKLSSFGITEINYKGIGVEDDVRIEVTVPVKADSAQVPMAVPVSKDASKK